MIVSKKITMKEESMKSIVSGRTQQNNVELSLDTKTCLELRDS